MRRKSTAHPVTRRDLLAGTGVASLGMLAAPGALAREAATGSGPADAVSVMKKGIYATVPLRQDSINVSALQSRLMSIDLKNRDATLKRNLAHVVKLIDYAQSAAPE